MGHVLGIDLGTTGVRCLVCDEECRVVGSAGAEYPSASPRPGWSEQSPRDWWDVTARATRQALDNARLSGDEVRCVGLSGQMHGAVFLDRRGEPLRPAILWNDQRAGRECDEIHARVGRPELIRLTCNPALAGFTAPKILWVRNNEPDVYAGTAKVLLPKDYVRYCMSGAFATEVSDASGTLLLEVPKRRWCGEVLRKLDIDAALMPDCFESEEISAQVSRDGAAALGIPVDTPIIGGAGDQAAGAIGNGIVRPGVVCATLGTSGVLFAFSDAPQTDPQGRVHTFCHAVRGKWHVMGVMLSAGGSLQWWRNRMAERDPYDILCEEAEAADPGSEGLIFLPYLTGERTPHGDPNARGGWIGLNVRHTKSHMIRSLIEGVCYGMRDSLEIIREMGIPVAEVRVSGGGGRNRLWRRVLADVYAHDVCATSAAEGPAFGVALLAAVATGCFKDIREACDATIRQTSITKPDADNVAVYGKYYAVYRRLYPALKEEFARIGQIVGSQDKDHPNG